MSLDNRHKLTRPYWARPGVALLALPADDQGAGGDDVDEDDSDEDDEDEEEDDPDEGKSEAELRAEVKAGRAALAEAGRREVRRKKEAARLRKRNVAATAKPADVDAVPDADAIRAEAQSGADERVKRAEARAELRSLVAPERLDRALKLLDLSDVILDGDEPDGLDDAIEALRADVPELFAKTTRKRRQVSGDSDREGKATPAARSASQIQADRIAGLK